MIPSPGPLDLALGAGFVLAHAGLSAMLGLGLARTILVAACRLTAQLTLVGLVLRTVFGLGAPGPVVGVVAVMALAAAYEIGARQERPLRGRGATGSAASSPRGRPSSPSRSASRRCARSPGGTRTR